jgi:hypothetical protein
MRHLITETERRVGQGPEYEQLLADMEGHYLTCRYVGFCIACVLDFCILVLYMRRMALVPACRCQPYAWHF